MTPEGDREIYLTCRSIALSILDRLDDCDVSALAEEVKASSESALRLALEHLGQPRADRVF